MGKKTKKKGGNSSKRKGQKGTSTHGTTTTKSQPKLDSDQISLYRIYKYCTEAVIQWGKITFYKKQGPKPKKETLSHVIFDILGSLAHDGVLMPEPVLYDLKLAISYRKRVRNFYRTLKEVNEDDFVRHEWIIQQLEQVSKAFRENKRKTKQHTPDEEKDDPEGESVPRQRLEGFEVLAISDDEESVASIEIEPTADASQTKKAIVFETPPTRAEIQREERQFAISLFMHEIDTIRNSLRERWRKWAKQAGSCSDAEAAPNLLAVTSSTQYALSAARKSVLQMSMEIDDFPDFDRLVELIGDSSSAHQKQQYEQTDFNEGDLVTIHSLEKKPHLNKKHGFVSNPIDRTSDRITVQVFPSDIEKKGSTISIKPENLRLSDNTYLRLCQIHSAMGSLNLKLMDTPSTPSMQYGAPTSTSVQRCGIQLIMQGDKFEKAARISDYETFLDLTVQYSLPLWISFTKYLPDMGAADSVLVAYIRDYANDGKLKFALTFALLVAIDGAMACAREKESLAEETKDLFVQVIRQVFTSQAYTPAIRLLEKDSKKANALYSHYELTRHMSEEYSLAAMFFPLFAGECMLTGLKMHFVCGSGFPYAYVSQFTQVLHIYWVLRSEGYLGKIPELESVVGIYQQQVFFRGGLAKKGQEAYTKCQQLALGVSAQAMRYLDGKVAARKTGRGPYNSDALRMDGLHVSEISRLLDILQWKSMPMVDKDSCFDKIERIAREEYSTIFTAPILEVSVKLAELICTLELGMTQMARESGERILSNFSIHTSRMTPIDLVTFWVMSLGDDRSVVPGEKEHVLRLLTGRFKSTFAGGTEPISSDDEPTIVFSTNDHKVDSSLWGEKGVRLVQNLHI